MRILIAEDDRSSREILQALLTKFGHEVETTSNGAAAWEAMQKPDAPRMAILDWMMPELDGLEVCKRLRATQTERPPYLIMLTARSQTDYVVNGLEAGADDYLTKPYDGNELRARIAVGNRLLDAQDRLFERVEELRNSLAEIKTLRGIIPICSYCNKIRDDQDYWRRVEEYIQTFTSAKFSHSICPECLDKVLRDVDAGG